MFYADWLRALSIILVIFVHALVNSFDASGLDPEDHPTIQEKKDGIIKCLVQVGIPMFFYISGIGATFFRTEEKNFAVFLCEKSLRLLLPFAAAIFVFLIPRLYFGQQYEDFTRPDDVIELDYWTFMVKTLPTIHLKLSWLWYLPALFIDFMLTYPLLRWTIRRSKGLPFDACIDLGIIAHQLVALALWGVICVYLVTKDNLGVELLVPAVITLGGIFFAFYTLQLLAAQKDSGYQWAIWLKFIGPLGSIALNVWKNQVKDQNLYHIFLMICYDAVFFSQGVIDMLYWRKMLRKRREIANTFWAPLFVGIVILLYSICSPSNYKDFGQLFFYPLYDEFWLRCLYTTGTWTGVFITVWYMASIGNEKFNDTVYKYVTGSALYAYLSHYFFILIISVGVVRPYQIGFIPGLFLMFFGTFLLIFITYWPLNYFIESLFPPVESKKADIEEIPDGEEPDEGLAPTPQPPVEETP